MKKIRLKNIMALILLIFLILTQSKMITFAEGVGSYYPKKIITNIENKTLYVGGPTEFSEFNVISSIEPNEANQNLNYTVENEEILSVDEEGFLIAKKVGNTKLKIITEELGKNSKVIEKKIPIKIKEFIYPESISIKGEDLIISNGEKTTIYASVSPGNATDKGYIFRSSDNSIATIDSNGVVYANTNGIVGEVVISAIANQPNKDGTPIKKDIVITVELSKENSNVNNISQVTIHDPSIFYDPNSKSYYSYGSHIAAGKSKDAVSWTYIANSEFGYGRENKLFENWYFEEFKHIYKWLYNYSEEDILNIIAGNSKAPEGIWAIDITYSEKAEKEGKAPYFMYVTVCNNSWKSAIVLCTSDNPESGFKYKETIVCSDYTDTEVDLGNTNLLEVLEMNNTKEVKEKYGEYYFPDGFRSSGAQVPDCIDANPYYDKENNLYLSYGSFTCYGGIRVLKLDSITGGRSKENYDYVKDNNEVISDPYFGKKIANKYGEGPYVLPVKDTTGNSSTGYYYFLFYSQGNLNPYGGYNMRVMRSEYPDDGFIDYSGNSALKTNISQVNMGLRIMDNYKFSFMKYASTANGGNSAIVTPGGKLILQYHSKSDDGTFGHIVKNQQMFLNEEGWLVTTPFTYKGERIDEIDINEIIGEYEFIYHRLSYSNTGSLTNKYDYVNSEIIKLNDDGSVTGEYKGSWEYDNNKNFIKINIEGKDYNGVVIEQRMDDELNTKTVVFGATGKDNRTIWGSKINKSSLERVEFDLEKIFIESNIDKTFNIDTIGFFGSNISWKSNSEAIRIEEDKAIVIPQDFDSKVILTASVNYDDISLSKDFEILVKAENIEIDTVVRYDEILLPRKTAAGKNITWSSSNPDVISNEGKVNLPEDESVLVTLTANIENSDRILVFEVTVLPIKIDEYIYTENYDSIKNVTDVWQSPNAANRLSIENSSEGGQYVKFATQGDNSRGAYSNFNLEKGVNDIYIVEFDILLKAGNNQETNFALTSKDFKYIGSNVNNGIESGYILKLSSINSTNWNINDSNEKVSLPSEQWVHITLSVNRKTKKTSLSINDKENVYYKGVIDIHGDGDLNGFYIRGGRYQSVMGVDNLLVY